MNTHDKYELPPPTELYYHSNGDKEPIRVKGYTREQVIAAIEADRKRRVEPVAWSYELARSITPEGEYCDWDIEPRLSFSKPSVPAKSIRNLKALYDTPQPAEPCDHSYHYFGDYPIRRCNKCKELEQQPAEPVKVDAEASVPSNTEILEVWYESPSGTIEHEVIEFARALLARYGEPAQPAEWEDFPK